MGKNKKSIQLIIFGIILVIGAFTIINNLSSKAPEYPKEGSNAPGYTLLDLNGEKISFSDIAKGKIVIMNFWGTFCPPCKAEMPALQSQYEKWKDQGVEVLGINQDKSRITAQRFVEQYNISFLSLHDDAEAVRKMYGVTDFPTTFFIGADGIVKEIRVGEMTEDYIERTIKRLVEEKQVGTE